MVLSVLSKKTMHHGETRAVCKETMDRCHPRTTCTHYSCSTPHDLSQSWRLNYHLVIAAFFAGVLDDHMQHPLLQEAEAQVPDALKPLARIV